MLAIAQIKTGAVSKMNYVGVRIGIKSKLTRRKVDLK